MTRETAGLYVRRLDEGQYAAWNDFVAGAASGSIYALPEYLDILCRAAGGRFFILGVYRGEALVAGMPVYQARSGTGWVTTARRLLSYNGPVLRDYPDSSPGRRIARQAATLAALERHLRRLDCADVRLRIRHPVTDLRPFTEAGWQVRPIYSFVVDIADLDAAWARCDHDLRRLVQRAREHGLSLGEDDDFDSLYRLHRQVHRRKGLPPYLGETAFRDYFEALRARGLGRLYHARLPDGTAAASQLVLTSAHPVSHTVCAASDVEQLALGGNPFLRWRVLEALSALGYRGNDLTGAALADDATRFKRQLGGELVLNWAVNRPLPLRWRLAQAVAGLFRNGSAPHRG